MIARILPPGEWGRLDITKMPLVPGVSADNLRVAVVEDGNRLAASVMAAQVTHLQGVWIDPEYRNAGVARKLMRLADATAREWGNACAFIGGSSAGTCSILRRLGAVELPMPFYVIRLGEVDA